jgi:hypothetical protein
MLAGGPIRSVGRAGSRLAGGVRRHPEGGVSARTLLAARAIGHVPAGGNFAQALMAAGYRLAHDYTPQVDRLGYRGDPISPR